MSKLKKMTSKNKILPLRQLKVKAKKAMMKAYSPYSKMKVGCALVDEKGRIFTGCNVENASYGGTICAERVAITKAISEGAKSISQILIMTPHSPPWSPCGLCRQVILEFSSPKTQVVMTNPKGEDIHTDVETLCPLSFSSEQMGL